MEKEVLFSVLGIIAGAILAILALFLLIRESRQGGLAGMRKIYWIVLLFVGVSGIAGSIVSLTTR